MSAQLTPVFPSDLITPGDIYFARLDAQRSGDIKSWWLVLRCSEDLLPRSFLDSKNPQARTFPFWVIGRPQFVWLDRVSLFMLHPSQKSAFNQTEFHDRFDALYDLATGAAKEEPFSVFQQEITDARNSCMSHDIRKASETRHHLREHSTGLQSSADDALFIADNDEMEEPNSPSVRVTTTDVPRKRRRQNTQTPVIIRPSKINKTPSISLQEEITLLGYSNGQAGVQIKTEAEENQVQYATAVNAVERVRVFIGTKEFTTSRKALERSPILSSYIQKDDYGSFIMHPKLNETREDDFLTVLDFMQRGEFAPRAVSQPGGQRRSGPMALEGFNRSEDYSTELIRCGRLYLLGKAFQITNLNAYIVRRIATTQYRPYSVASVITFARIIFRYSGHHRAGFQQDSIASKEAMEQWVISALAENFQEIMQVSADRDLFWVMEKETTSRRLVAEIFTKCADNYSKIGGMPVKID